MSTDVRGINLEATCTSLQNIHLGPHATARSRALSLKTLKPGESIVSDTAWSMVLLPEEKSHRCDWCGCLPQMPLRKCSGCVSYWYCGSACQLRQWKSHHKTMCKLYSQYVASTDYQILSPDEKVDAVLLSQILAEINQSKSSLLVSQDPCSAYAIFLSLLEGRQPTLFVPPVCGSMSDTSAAFVKRLYSRFGNNNFVLHSHLVSFALGIFPLASRLFNHSCQPNAVVKYVLESGHPPRMEVVAICDIKEHEEVTIPYLDPALPFDIRQKRLQRAYGFSCTCPPCVFMSGVNLIPNLQHGERPHVEAMLRKYLFPSGADRPQNIHLPKVGLSTFPPSLLPVLHESYIPTLSETFSKASHEGQYSIALDVGLTLLALYAVIYPPNYPLIGLHLLELAKTAWNASVEDKDAGHQGELIEDARSYLKVAHDVLSILGPEGDRTGPMEEIQTLTGLLGNG